MVATAIRVHFPVVARHGADLALVVYSTLRGLYTSSEPFMKPTKRPVATAAMAVKVAFRSNTLCSAICVAAGRDRRDGERERGGEELEGRA